jgi:hypothetical protein
MAPSSIQSQRRLLPDEAVGVAVALVGVAEALVGVAEALVGVGDGVAVTVTVVAGAVVVTVTVGFAGDVAVGLAGVVSVAAAGSERLAKLLIALEALLPILLEQPVARHATSRMAAARKRLFVERRMLLPSALFMAG